VANLPSKTQLDKLGERLRSGSRDETDLKALDDYRRSFRDAYEFVITAVQGQGWNATGRPAKTTTAIVEKLNRQNSRLTQIQDIGGLRLVVTDISSQNAIVDELRSMFRTTDVIDRRIKPSHGYRAVHVVVSVNGKPIEIQVRTTAQHLWAEISEKLSDTVDPAVKYGGGPEETKRQLVVYSEVVRSIEDAESELATWRRDLSELERIQSVIPATDPDHHRLVVLVDRSRQTIRERETVESRFKDKLIELLKEAYNEIGLG
jgi:ppGpp synthetase/RelA/SpoT-type nucleotidyltranferase